MKSTEERRKFLALAAAASTASLGLAWKSFAAPTMHDVHPHEGAGNVRSFGAKGDGKTDDTQAIQAAIDAAVGQVYFPKGSYRISRPLEVDLQQTGYFSISGGGISLVKMAGPGPAIRVRGSHSKSANPRTFEEGVWEKERMPLLDGLAIEGDHPEAVGIEAVGTMQLIISRTQVRKALHGIHLTGNNRNLIVSDCHLYQNHGIGIFYDDVDIHQSNITGSHISYNHRGGIISRGGSVRNVHIAGCDIESNMGADEAPTANILIDCSSSFSGTAEVAITGCTIQHNSESPDSANIRIIGQSRLDSPPLHPWGHVTITGNVMSDVMVNVHLHACRGVSISGNTFWKGYGHNMLVEDCSNVLIGPNLFDNNPNYERGGRKANNNLVVRNSKNCTFTGLHITGTYGPAGLLVEDAYRMNITNCTILDCENVGLLLKNVSSSRVSGCLIANENSDLPFTPLLVAGGKGNIIQNENS